jgi:hypothetical protein
MRDVHDIAFDVARELFQENGAYEDWVADYLSELIEFSLLRKQDMLTTDRVETRHFHYDFIALEQCDFNEGPRDHACLDGVNIHFAHDDVQKELISGYCKAYGMSNSGLGNIFGMGKNVRSFYRRIETAPHTEIRATASCALSGST